MPNWCENFYIIKHSLKEEIDRVELAFNQNRLCQTFIPVPEDLIIDESEEYEIYVRKEADNFLKYGYKNSNEFCRDKWGTKWEVFPNGELARRIDDFTLEIQFESAWRPPEGVLFKMERCGFSVEGYYFEPNGCFAGKYNNGEYHFLEFADDWKWLESYLPEDLNHHFKISDMYKKSSERNL